jgi:probable F420-dependent oxidoreductase
VKFGIPLARLNPAFYASAAIEADKAGFESVWFAEHLVLPVQMSGSPYPGQEHPPVPPDVHVFDAFAYLCFIAAKTEHVRLGTHVYNIGLRHPFVTARAVQTLDILSGGRAIVGIGTSWLKEEWDSVELDFGTRGRRVDEAVSVCQRLWSEKVVEHHGEFFDFGPVVFEPKPIQKPWPPIVVGGQSEAAMRRAATLGEGWIGLGHTPESVLPFVTRLRALRKEAGRGAEPFELTVRGDVETPDDIKRWEEAGVDRVLVHPWRRSPEAAEGLRRFADMAWS